MNDPSVLAGIAQSYRTELGLLVPSAPCDEEPGLAVTLAEGIIGPQLTQSEEQPSEAACRTDAPPLHAEAPAPADVTDAQPAPSSVPAGPPPTTEPQVSQRTRQVTRAVPDPAGRKNRKSFAARHAKPKHVAAQFPLMLTLALATLLALNGALIGWRSDVVRVAPQTASLYAALALPVNLRGLVFADVRTSAEMQGGVPVLVVEGSIASASKRPIAVPRLRFSIRNGAGQEVYSWTALARREILAPGETVPFQSRLAAPPSDAQRLVVRFHTRRDLVTTALTTLDRRTN
ncbi:MAG: FxLYD domain-containing protein [Xanthobacteraceae bacterium]